MANGNNTLIFIFVLISAMFLDLLANSAQWFWVEFYGELFTLLVVLVASIGLFISASRQRKSKAQVYYAFLGIVSLFLMVSVVFFKVPFEALYQGLLILSVLIALFIAILDYRQYLINEIKLKAKFDMQMEKAKKDHAKAIKAMEKQVATLEKKAESLEKSKSKCDITIKKKQDELKKLEKEKKQMKGFAREKAKLEKEIAKQTELKQKYSKTLNTIRKTRKAEQELLVVSQDGSSVHRPHCIAVRNIAKDSRKLIKNWKVAEKEGYKGCKLCKPHIKPKTITKGSTKYGFVASKNGDKVHKVSCLLVKNIDGKDRQYFTSFKKALDKGYTGCRVCNPAEK